VTGAPDAVVFRAMTAPELRSISHVCDVSLHRGAAAAGDATPSLLVEIPHGATRAAHFTSLRAALRGPFPDGIEDFFFVNTDVGAPEVAECLAKRFVAARPTATALVVRCLVPRTFIDCNRVIDATSRPAASTAGQMTPGVAEYVRDADDFRLLFARYSEYRGLVARAVDVVCGAGGRAVMAHSYAPRSIDVPVDDRIVERLRAEYRPDAIVKWPLRAEVDLITTAPDGTMLAYAALVARVRAAYEHEGFVVAQNGSYGLHPSSMAWVYATKYPGRTLCIELRRDLLMREFTPFQEMEIDPAKAERMAAALASALIA
jgi:predicted N-formylglutamate amidohydrolase